MKIDRMLTIIVMLLNRKRTSAKELSEKFEISVRTVYRDIEAINQAGIPVISYPGNNGGFGIVDNYKLSHQVLTINNLCSMLSALKGINSTLEDIELESSIEKLRNIIPQDKAQDLDLHMEQIIIAMQPWAFNAKQKQQVKVIQQAISKLQLISITYRNYSSQASSRQIEPMSLIFKGYTWYLFAYCHLKADFRVFRLSRIIKLKVEEGTFIRKEKSYHDMEAANEKQSTSTNITLKFSAQVRSRVEDVFNEQDIKLLSNGYTIVTAQFVDQDWVFTLILSFGEFVEVLGPEPVRQTIATRIGLMNKHYQS